MPFRPPTHDQLVGSRRASQRAYDQTRGPDHAFYSSARWRRLRLVVLNEEPCCYVCTAMGITRASTQVDHSKPRRMHPELELVRENCRGMCDTHHSQKTVAEKQGIEWVQPQPVVPTQTD